MVGNELIWPAFTSTSKTIEYMTSFAAKKSYPSSELPKTGTLMIIDVIEGYDISPLSLYDREEEVILLPNSRFLIKEIVGKNCKQILNCPNDLDIMYLEQILPTQSLWKEK